MFNYIIMFLFLFGGDVLHVEPDSVLLPQHDGISEQITISGSVNGTGTVKLVVAGPAGQKNQTLPLTENGNFFTVYRIDRYSNTGKYNLILEYGGQKAYASFVVYDQTKDTITINHGASKGQCNPCIDPQKYVVSPGTIVSWENIDSTVHLLSSGTPKSPTNVFLSSHILPGQIFSHTFEKESSIQYFCKIHPWLVGIIEVQRPDNVSNHTAPDQTAPDQTAPSPTTNRLDVTLNKKELAAGDELVVTVTSSTDTAYISILGKNTSIFDRIDTHNVGYYRMPITEKMEGTYSVTVRSQSGGDIKKVEQSFNVIPTANKIENKIESTTENTIKNTTENTIENTTENTIENTTENKTENKTENTEEDQMQILIFAAAAAAIGAGIYIVKKAKRQDPVTKFQVELKQHEEK